MNSLLNAAVLLFWWLGALLFTALRLAMRHLKPPKDAVRRPSWVRLFFSCLARVLGNSDGEDDARCVWKSETFVMFVIGMFALLTSMLFTGALFEKPLASEPLRQIDTLAEIMETKLPIIGIFGDCNVIHR